LLFLGLYVVADCIRNKVTRLCTTVHVVWHFACSILWCGMRASDANLMDHLVLSCVIMLLCV